MQKIDVGRLGSMLLETREALKFSRLAEAEAQAEAEAAERIAYMDNMFSQRETYPLVIYCSGQWKVQIGVGSGQYLQAERIDSQGTGHTGFISQFPDRTC